MQSDRSQRQLAESREECLTAQHSTTQWNAPWGEAPEIWFRPGSATNFQERRFTSPSLSVFSYKTGVVTIQSRWSGDVEVPPGLGFGAALLLHLGGILWHFVLLEHRHLTLS